MAIQMCDVKGKHCPRVVCDVCNKPISKGSEGMVRFNGVDTTLFFNHKETCDRDGDDDKYPLWHELDTFLVWLTDNTKMDWKAAKQKAQMLAAM